MWWWWPPVQMALKGTRQIHGGRGLSRVTIYDGWMEPPCSETACRNTSYWQAIGRGWAVLPSCPNCGFPGSIGLIIGCWTGWNFCLTQQGYLLYAITVYGTNCKQMYHPFVAVILCLSGMLITWLFPCFFIILLFNKTQLLLSRICILCLLRSANCSCRTAEYSYTSFILFSRSDSYFFIPHRVSFRDQNLHKGFAGVHQTGTFQHALHTALSEKPPKFWLMFPHYFWFLQWWIMQSPLPLCFCHVKETGL